MLRPIRSSPSTRKASANWSARRRARRKTRPDIKLGICGEHGGDPASIGFCESVGLDYVSCSPYRVPIARLRRRRRRSSRRSVSA
jgi:phosphoenolpyruvate synthase/pyruvate phosphate dikinase